MDHCGLCGVEIPYDFYFSASFPKRCNHCSRVDTHCRVMRINWKTRKSTILMINSEWDSTDTIDLEEAQADFFKEYVTKEKLSEEMKGELMKRSHDIFQ